MIEDYQYSLTYEDTEIVFGRTTPYNIESFEIGDAGITTADTSRPRADGIMFGRDYKSARTLTWTGNITRRGPNRRDLVVGDLNQLETVWDAQTIRQASDTACVLHIKRGANSLPLRVYGRPRRFTPVTGRTEQGWIPFTMDFQTIDTCYYDDDEQSMSLSMAPEAVGGFPVPFVGGWIANGQGLGRDHLQVGGTLPAWIVIKLYGPITGSWVNPVVEINNGWTVKLTGEIRYDQSVVIDPTPWDRGVRRNDGANWTGRIPPSSQRLSGMRLNPGTYDVTIKGTDSSMTARAEIYWRDVYNSHTAVV